MKVVQKSTKNYSQDTCTCPNSSWDLILLSISLHANQLFDLKKILYRDICTTNERQNKL